MIATEEYNGLRVTTYRDPEIADLVRELVEIKGSTEYSTEHIFPRNTPEILINLGKPLVGSLNGGHYTFSKYVLQGAKTAPFQVAPSSDQHFISIRFEPNGFYKFLGIPQDEFTDHFFKLNDYFPDVEEFRTSLQHAQAVGDRFKYLLDWIQSVRTEGDHQQNLLSDHLIFQFENTPRITVKELEQKSGFSRKHLSCTFKKQAGIPLKLYQRIDRFQRALKLIKQPQKTRWTELAYRTGYYDQSHFIRDFKHFTGFVPTEFCKQKMHGSHLIEG